MRRLFLATFAALVLLFAGLLPGNPPIAWDGLVGGTAAAAATDKQKRREAREKRNKKRRAIKAGGEGADDAVPLPRPRPDRVPAAEAEAAGEAEAAADWQQPKEAVEADVSTRSISVTSAFRGTEIVVFGSIDNSRQSSPESGYYDVIVVLEGQAVPAVVRRKSNVAGLWVNMSAAEFKGVPSYYATASTRPMEEIADADLLRENVIGYRFLRFTARPSVLNTMLASEVQHYRDALTRLKEEEGLFLREDYGVAFIGRSLFRTSIELPANIPVGQLQARVYLFHEGTLLSRYATRVNLHRAGLELWIYDFAQTHSVLYGSLTVLLALMSGLAASAIFRRVG